jgi:hypothetical protein
MNLPGRTRRYVPQGLVREAIERAEDAEDRIAAALDSVIVTPPGPDTRSEPGRLHIPSSGRERGHAEHDLEVLLISIAMDALMHPLIAGLRPVPQRGVDGRLLPGGTVEAGDSHRQRRPGHGGPSVAPSHGEPDE